MHVDALTMRADRTHVAVGEDVRVTIHAHVRERISALDELVIPDAGTMHVLGDERRAAQSAGGTDIDEILTLEAAQPGTVVLAGASLDAIDARTGKPTRFTANAVRIIVGGTTASSWPRIVAAAVLAVALIAMGTLVALRVLRRRGPIVVQSTGPLPTAGALTVVPRQPASPRDDVGAALAAYRASLSLSDHAALRAALYRAAGARAGATLRDAEAATSDRTLVDVIRRADAVAFSADRSHAAATDLIDAVDGWLG